MIISINDVLIKKQNLSIEEFFYLLNLYLKIDITKLDKSNLLNNGLIGERLRFNLTTGKSEVEREYLTDKAKVVLEDILIESDKQIETVNNLESLAKQMQELFPKGRKDGTNYYWRGNTPEIIRKLQIFFKRYGNIPHETILEATKNYTQSFDCGNTHFMQLLKYFIWKDKPDGSQESALLTFIENHNPEDVITNEDWTSNLK